MNDWSGPQKMARRMIAVSTMAVGEDQKSATPCRSTERIRVRSNKFPKTNPKTIAGAENPNRLRHNPMK